MARFDLEGFKRGESCYAMNGMRATYLFTMKNVPAPIIVQLDPFDTWHSDEYDDSIESYTVNGKHIIDPELDLISGIFISHNYISPTVENRLDYFDWIHEQREKEEWIQKQTHNNYYIF